MGELIPGAKGEEEEAVGGEEGGGEEEEEAAQGPPALSDSIREAKYACAHHIVSEDGHAGEDGGLVGEGGGKEEEVLSG